MGLFGEKNEKGSVGFCEKGSLADFLALKNSQTTGF